jgi:hypothetical protein
MSLCALRFQPQFQGSSSSSSSNQRRRRSSFGGGFPPTTLRRSSRRRQTITAAEQQQQQHPLESNTFASESNGSTIITDSNQSQDESLESLTSRSQNVAQSEPQRQNHRHQHRYSLSSSTTSYYRSPNTHSLFGSSLLGCGVGVNPSSDEDFEEWSESGIASHEKMTSSIDDDESVASLCTDIRAGGSEDDDELDDLHSVYTNTTSQSASFYAMRSVSMSPRTVISDDAGSGSFATALLAPPVRTVSLSPAQFQGASFSTTQFVTTTTTTIRTTTTTTRTSFLAGHSAASSMPMVLVSDDDQSFQSLCDDHSMGSNDGYYSVGRNNRIVSTRI